MLRGIISSSRPDWPAAVPTLLRLSLVIICGFVFWMPGTARGEVAVISVDYADTQELMPAVRMLLSETGKASFDRRTHSLVVVDNPSVVADIRTLLEKLDRPARQLTLRVRFIEKTRQTDQDISAHGQVTGPGWSAGTPGGNPNRIDLSMTASNRSQNNTTEQVLRVQSGSAAVITVGRDIPFTRRWADVCRHFSHCRKLTDFKRIETGFEVTPRVQGNTVLLHIAPRLGSMAEGPAGSATLVEAATEIFAEPGQWIDLGSVAVAGNEVFSEILGLGSSGKDKRVDIRLMVNTEP